MASHILKIVTEPNGTYRFKRATSGKKNHSSGKYKDPVLITPLEEAKQFMEDCFIAVGTPNEHAEIAATSLITADQRGYYSHGMNRLENYIRDIQEGRTNPCACPVVLKETEAVALVDGKNGLGSVIGNRSMDLAMMKAKKVGIGLVCARGCNHYGLASLYPLQAMEEGLIGLTVTNTSPLMVPIRAKKAALGTNPISVGALAKQGDNFVLDMATTAVSAGKIEIYKRKNQRLPLGWALNDIGKPETDPKAAAKTKNFMPLGGTEGNSGYKGYGLAILVEVLSGLLAGSAYGPRIRKWGTGSQSKKPANLGSSFMAIEPKAFEENFEERLQDLICYLRKMEPVDDRKPVIVHGDLERKHMQQVEADGGLRYAGSQHKTMEKLAAELKVELPCSKK